MEGFDLGRLHAEGPHDPGRAAREAADRIAEQVRDILQNAEQRADEIRRTAESDAEAIRRDAAEAAARMLGRIDDLERRLQGNLGEFFEGIREELSQLASRQDIDAAAARFHTQELAAEQPPEPASEPQPEPEAEHEAASEEDDEPRRRRGLLRGRRDRAGDGETPPSAASAEAEDAHVMALNMALNGTPREETESYLVQRFTQVDDLDSILDDVYGRVKSR